MEIARSWYVRALEHLELGGDPVPEYTAAGNKFETWIELLVAAVAADVGHGEYETLRRAVDRAWLRRGSPPQHVFAAREWLLWGAARMLDAACTRGPGDPAEEDMRAWKQALLLVREGNPQDYAQETLSRALVVLPLRWNSIRTTEQHSIALYVRLLDRAIARVLLMATPEADVRRLSAEYMTATFSIKRELVQLHDVQLRWRMPLIGQLALVPELAPTLFRRAFGDTGIVTAAEMVLGPLRHALPAYEISPGEIEREAQVKNREEGERVSADEILCTMRATDNAELSEIAQNVCSMTWLREMLVDGKHASAKRPWLREAVLAAAFEHWVAMASSGAYTGWRMQHYVPRHMVRNNVAWTPESRLERVADLPVILALALGQYTVYTPHDRQYVNCGTSFDCALVVWADVFHRMHAGERFFPFLLA